MKDALRRAIFICALLSPFALYSQAEIGMDVGQPINPTTGAINLGVDTGIVGTTCAPWVRVNFILGPWSSPGDQTLYNGKTWQQTYDEIINAFVAKGIKVYGLIGHEAYTYPVDTLEQYPGNATNADAWIQGYTYNFVQIVGMFKDRIRVFESFNEPNNWTNSSTAIVHAAWFAKILQEVYLNTKYYNGHNLDSSWQVTLVSGALFTFDLNGGGQFISDAYWYGKNVWAWDWAHQNAGSYPLDGLGQHIYVAQGDSDVNVVSGAITTNLNDLYSGAFTYEDDVSKQIWVSEFGWESGVHGESFQAQDLTTGFNTLQNDSRVRLALWFTQSDFPGGDWGLYYMGNYTPADQKQSFAAFKSRNNCNYTTGAQSAQLLNLQLVKSDASYFLRGETQSVSGYIIYGAAGQVVLDRKLPQQEKDTIEIDVRGLSAGLYLLLVKDGVQGRCFKLLQN